MKDNTADSKQLLKRALTNLPQDFALREVQFHIRQALSKIEQVEAKRSKRETTQAQNQTLQNNIYNPYSPTQTLNIIDQLIADERAKLESLQAKKIMPKHRDEDDETLFG